LDIQTLHISAGDENAIGFCLDILESGGLVAFPTDTVYGLGCLVNDSAAIEKIYLAKQRPAEKAIPILIGSISDLEKVAIDFPPAAARLAGRFWPGPLTLVLPKKHELPDALSDSPTIGVRIPDHPVARKLLMAAGPMAVTSANQSGHKSPRTAAQVLAQLNGRIQLVLDGGETPGGIPSTVVNCLGSEAVILREGPISRDDIQSLLV
jgi:L-threonylcarbamoyladenylate synthase